MGNVISDLDVNASLTITNASSYELFIVPLLSDSTVSLPANSSPGVTTVTLPTLTTAFSQGQSVLDSSKVGSLGFYDLPLDQKHFELLDGGGELPSDTEVSVSMVAMGAVVFVKLENVGGPLYRPILLGTSFAQFTGLPDGGESIGDSVFQAVTSLDFTALAAGYIAIEMEEGVDPIEPDLVRPNVSFFEGDPTKPEFMFIDEYINGLSDAKDITISNEADIPNVARSLLRSHLRTHACVFKTSEVHLSGLTGGAQEETEIRDFMVQRLQTVREYLIDTIHTFGNASSESSSEWAPFLEWESSCDMELEEAPEEPSSGTNGSSEEGGTGGSSGSDTDTSPSDSLDTVTIILICVGSAVALVVIVVIIVALRRRKSGSYEEDIQGGNLSIDSSLFPAVI